MWLWFEQYSSNRVQKFWKNLKEESVLKCHQKSLLQWGGIQNPKRNGQEAENSLKDIDGGIIWILTNCSALIRGS